MLRLALLTAMLLVSLNRGTAVLLSFCLKTLSHLSLLSALSGVSALKQLCCLAVTLGSLFELLCRRDMLTRTLVGWTCHVRSLRLCPSARLTLGSMNGWIGASPY
jgi:hypothetical protein